MRSNWEELPAFVRFANNKGASVFFHMVWNPEHQALWNLDAKTLKHIGIQLARADLPKSTKNEKRNYKKFLDYLNLIKKWENDSKEREGRLAMEKEQERIERKRESQKNKELIAAKETYFEPLITSMGAQQVLMSELEKHLVSREIPSESNQKTLLNQYHEQLNWLSGQLPKQLSSEAVYQSLLARRPIENVARELEKNDKTALLKTAIEYAENLVKE